MIVKICGVRNQADAEFAIASGADMLGFVHEPSSPRYVGENWAPEWLFNLPVPRVAVFGECSVPAAASFTHLQAHTWDTVDLRPRLCVYRMGSGLEVPTNGEFLLLDAFHPTQHGGSGQQVDWDQAAEIVTASPIPVILAGGLTPDNVAEAIRRVRPAGVDVSSGTEKAPGIKDPERLRAFIENAKA